MNNAQILWNSQGTHIRWLVIGAHVRGNICDMICLRYLIRSSAVTKVFFQKRPFYSNTRATCSELLLTILYKDYGNSTASTAMTVWNSKFSITYTFSCTFGPVTYLNKLESWICSWTCNFLIPFSTYTIKLWRLNII